MTKLTGDIPAVANPDWGKLQEHICYKLIKESGFSETDAIEFSDEIVNLIHDWIMGQGYHDAKKATQVRSSKQKDDSFSELNKLVEEIIKRSTVTQGNNYYSKTPKV